MYQRLFDSPLKMETPKDLIGSVQRSLTILEYVAENPDGVNIKQVSLKLGLNLSTCYHLINTLVSCGYIVKHPETSFYCLSGKIGYTKNQQVSPSRLAHLLDPYVKSLKEKTSETTYASLWDGNEIFIVSKSESHLSVRVNALNLGFCEASHASALGKAILAYWDEPKLNKFISTHALSSYTKNTITDLNLLKADLEVVRKRGYSRDSEELFLDVFCLGVPVFDASGEILASIALALPASRFQQVGTGLLPLLLNTAKAASNMMRVLDFAGFTE